MALSISLGIRKKKKRYGDCIKPTIFGQVTSKACHVSFKVLSQVA